MSKISKEKKKLYSQTYNNNHKEQVRKYKKDYYDRNKEKIDFQRRKYWKDNPLRRMLRGVKHRSKKLNLPCDLTIEYFINIGIPEFCPVLGIRLEFKNGKGPQDSSPSIDRIIPELGYIKTNIRIISNRANVLKNNMSVAECEKILEDLKNCQNGFKQELSVLAV